LGREGVDKEKIMRNGMKELGRREMRMRRKRNEW
jgi:hypothetical protein